jgi:hypothetical protein
MTATDLMLCPSSMSGRTRARRGSAHSGRRCRPPAHSSRRPEVAQVAGAVTAVVLGIHHEAVTGQRPRDVVVTAGVLTRPVRDLHPPRAARHQDPSGRRQPACIRRRIGEAAAWHSGRQ